MDISIRDALTDDAPAIAGLLDQLGFPASAEDVAFRTTEWTRNPLSRVIVATLDERVVGMLAFHAIPFFEQDGRRGRVVSLAVDEKSRGNGIGSRLMSFIEVEARHLGCKDIELICARNREAAQAFYEQIGYADSSPGSARFIRRLSVTST